MQQIHPTQSSPRALDTTSSPPKQDALRLAAEQLEAGFLAEFLKSAGFGQSSADFGGGAGEDQFTSFLRQAQAESIVKAGGLGLAEAIYQSLLEEKDAQ